jgi:hypothetical protein
VNWKTILLAFMEISCKWLFVHEFFGGGLHCRHRLFGWFRFQYGCVARRRHVCLAASRTTNVVQSRAAVATLEHFASPQDTGVSWSVALVEELNCASERAVCCLQTMSINRSVGCSAEGTIAVLLLLLLLIFIPFLLLFLLLRCPRLVSLPLLNLQTC